MRMSNRRVVELVQRIQYPFDKAGDSTEAGDPAEALDFAEEGDPAKAVKEPERRLPESYRRNAADKPIGLW